MRGRDPILTPRVVITTYLYTFLGCVIGFVTIMLASMAIANAQEQKGAKPRETAEQKLVREYLKENLPTGKWEEIKWWGPKQIRNGDEEGPLAVRLKFRAANEMGNMTVYDDVFIFQKGNVKRLGPSSPYNGNKERIFGK